MTITCGIQTTGVVTMGTKVIHNTCNMAICDLPDMYAQSSRATGLMAEGIHIRQIPHGHVTTVTYNFIYILYLYTVNQEMFKVK